jgi:hypothetical protein
MTLKQIISAALVIGVLATSASASASEMAPRSVKVSQEQPLSTNFARCAGLLQVLGTRGKEAGDYFTIDYIGLGLHIGMAAMQALGEGNPRMGHADAAQLAIAKAREYEAIYAEILNQDGDLGLLAGDDAICVATAEHLKEQSR